ncbi:polyprenyl synthetase family protein [Afifella marina]|uniref:Probable farnesyl diphosphate synthase n=1 Tax=Afifella marina DSM 2698 TaxID=1120955 RepID=A0A1G5P1U7_AFIMA|nr:polyprenyl synthetase family protein [Afifella marina]MBK1624318.1 geranylgeranyl pyrophosphate synthase [Afifella marina DSM 2698]MBK1628050.1 geranylgeranyl pyrophosphate synthase [Afifella marina]MBK5918245.1 geranylgeranyl pyrophosphate synthase [Afifella marina]RAI19281.1 geranylgeranyl pyrophosphate synthase [Afifella marina DSM 2698]SCZ43149.1 geranylgeranyl diphosphate synthase, type II [Afifella marina DSM 2698]
MEALVRIEQALDMAVAYAEAPGAPPQLAQAMRYSVFPGGARIRPRLCLAVAHACGDDAPDLSNAAAAAIELFHCASLVHDDLPCFDDAELRRGRPSVHRAFGEPLAVLAGDALIVLAFETLARAGACAPQRLAGLTLTLARSVGMPSGIIAGQAWESEPRVSVSDYQRAKTGSLFVAATAAGALAAGADPAPWRALGDRLGEAYQVADDIGDAVAAEEDNGKPVGRDIALGRPSAVVQLGLAGAMERLRDLVKGAVASIPDCQGSDELKALVMSESTRLVPKQLSDRVAA